MKRFLITLFISGIVVSCVWIVPELGQVKSAENVEQVERLNPFEHREAYQEPNLLSLDTVPTAPIMAESTIEPPQMALMSEPKKEVDWQGLITWIIGSLNGLFGLALLVKKVFFKT